MKVNTRHEGEVTLLDLNGKITIGEGDVILREAVDRVLKEGRRQILLNLARVSYMDSAGIGELVACYKRSREKGGELKLLNPSGKVYDLLQLTKLEEIFETFRDEAEALRSF
jgi:anti-sigma B factor antagonist